MRLSIVDQVLAKFGAEDREQLRVIRYCDANQIPVFHVPNNTYTNHRFAKVKNMLLGVRPGVSDLFVFPNGYVCAIEMKSLTGAPTKAQKEWIAIFNAAGIPAIVAKGADVAIAFIERVGRGEVDPAELITGSGKRMVIMNDLIEPISDENPF